MPELKICSYEISFPYEPYKCQVDYMDKVIRTLSIGANSVLESPTGTGKTLCLLCAALGWQKSHIDSLRKREILKVDIPNSKQKVRPKYPIYYVSRTHNQLQQVVKELRKTVYTPTMTVLGSRTQLCLNEELQKIENNTHRNQMCKIKTKTQTCFFYTNYTKKAPVPLES
ncbi:hypothetical protein MXB_594 [Myxobolus squamalis]|nr:hypothetical protein MXB_594 [Myxobolus squamalis]